MDATTRKTCHGWTTKARIQLDTARNHLASFHHSEAVQASQECVELSVKALLSLLQIRFDYVHGWRGKSLENIAQQIAERRLLTKLAEQNIVGVDLPRLLFLAEFWAQFYLTAKYGLEAGYLASARELFKKDEAELAVRHGSECLSAAWRIVDLSNEALATINRNATI